MRGNEVIGNRKTFAEVRRDRQVDDLARRIGHEAAHAGELAHLLLVAACARIRHHEDGVEGVHVVHHGVRHIVRRLRPKRDDLVVALLVRNETAAELTLDAVDLLLRRREDVLLLLGHDDVGNRDRHARKTRVVIAEVLDVVDDDGRACGSEVVEAVCHELAELLLVHADAEAPLPRLLILVVIAQLLRQDLVEDHAPERSLDKAVSLDARLDLRLQRKLLMLVHQKSFLDARDDLALA